MEPQSDLSQQLQKVQRQVRRLHAVVGILVVISVCAMTMGAANLHDVVVANEFQMRDRTGAVRASLRMEENDQYPLLKFFDRQSQDTLVLGNIANQPTIMLLGRDGQVSWGACIIKSDNIVPTISLTSPRSRMQAEMTAEDQRQGIFIKDRGNIIKGAP
ncbi:MAG: hypothetical protein IAG10_19935 [Planctomycetaceae bacterium]|nr:hypothetical protein [Planctomycetaceae bacterium]